MAFAVELADARKLFNSGKYAECIEMCATGEAANLWEAEWSLLKIRAEQTTGQYEQAMRTLQAALGRQYSNVQLRFAGIEVLRQNNLPQEADRMLLSIRQLAIQDPTRYSSAADRIILGETLLKSGADPRQVLELFFDSAKRLSTTAIQPYFATGRLGLDKQDFALAAESFQAAAKLAPDDPDVYFGLARAYENNAEQANAALAKAMELNPKHIDSLLFQIDNALDQEAYDVAETLIKEVLTVNSKNPKALAYRAVLSHIIGDKTREDVLRNEALSTWKTNPEVDHIIGQKLSQKYRFKEGSEYQRQAIKFDANYQPAKLQLCQDLLRLGQEDEGWKLADEIFKADQYNVLAFNLSTLHDNLSKFRTITSEHFIVRMDVKEEQIYGERVLKLLERARETLGKKYDVQIDGKITVEIFNQQKDFAIRTFGLPGGAGYLGVCFGPVITVNSPATRGANPNNWEAVVWHEFCHAITLQKTNNKMPRWLSEGISVYEERRENPTWGQVMNPQYRDFILKGEATPVSKLSGAFLKPQSPLHLNFAYFESNMVVEYVVGRYGIEAIQKILTDLGAGVPINVALAKHTESIDKLDENFATWLKTQAEQLVPKGDLARPTELPLDAGSEAMIAWNKEHPNNFWGLLGEGRALLAERKWTQAIEPLQKAVELYPGYGMAGGPYLLLAEAYRELGQPEKERQMLEKHAAINSDGIEPRMRLIELAVNQNDWKGVNQYADQVLAINPLVPAPHRYLAQAAGHLGNRGLEIGARRTLLLMNPLDTADQHFRLAQLLVEENQLPEAKEHVVKSLEQAPRFKQAHQLLLQLAAKVEPASDRERDRPIPPVTPEVSPVPTPPMPETPASRPIAP